jgi:mono/diheme cytochrome c family protein
MRRPGLAALLAATLLGAAGCYLGSAGVTVDGGQRDSSGPQGSEGGVVSGLPCDVATLLESKCVSCHSSPPSGGAPMSLLTYADLKAPAPSNPNETVAQRSVERLLDGTSPMPPGAPDPASATILSSWIAAGYPQGDCGLDGGTNPYATAPTCTSGQYIQGSEDIGAAMHPGGACISCHRSSGEAPTFVIAGTVFPTAHEYNDCVSTAAGQGQVIITDNNGVDHAVSIGGSGNFVSQQAISLPYRARVVAGGRERAMSGSQQSGDCNSCHTLNGANGAPGRIMLP